MTQQGRGKGGPAGRVALQRGRGDSLHGPAGLGRAGRRFSPGPRQENGPSARLGGQQQSAAGGQVHGLGLAPGAQHHGPHGRASQGVFACRQQRSDIARAHQQQIQRPQSHLAQARRIGPSRFLRHRLMHRPDNRPPPRRFHSQPQAESIDRHRVARGGGVEIVQALRGEQCSNVLHLFYMSPRAPVESSRGDANCELNALPKGMRPSRRGLGAYYVYRLR